MRFLARISDELASWRRWWPAHYRGVLWALNGLLAVSAALKLGTEFHRLLFESGPQGAIDLRIFQRMVQTWVSGEPLYGIDRAANYPPASYVMLWPLVGWPEQSVARVLWAATTVLVLAWLIRLIVTESGARAFSEAVFVTLMCLGMNATGVTIGNGQPILHLLPPLITGLLLLARNPANWGADLLGAGLLLWALLKPSISTPFLWMALFLAGRLRPLALVAVGYGLLTAFSASFQEDNLPTLISGWLASSRAGAVRGGYANLHLWLHGVGLDALIPLSSAVALGLLGYWVYRNRGTDLWILLGVSGIVARLWTYHRLYDDLLILPAEVALFRLARGGASRDGSDVLAGVLLGLTVLSMLVPARFLREPNPLTPFAQAEHAIVWLIVLAFLVSQARRSAQAGADA